MCLIGVRTFPPGTIFPRISPSRTIPLPFTWLMGRVAKLKLQYFGHITRGSAGQLVALTVLEGIMEGLRHQGRPRRQWIHDIEEWTGCEYIQLKETSQDRAQ